MTNFQKWLHALRNPIYTQTTGVLRKATPSIPNCVQSESFCALGVAFDIYLKEHSIEWNESNPTVHYSTLHKWIGYNPEVIAVPVNNLTEFKNIVAKNPDNISNDIVNWVIGPVDKDTNAHLILVTDLNDSLKLSLPLIAELLETFPTKNSPYEI